MNMSRHDANFALTGGDDSRTIRPNQARTSVLQELPSSHHIEDGNALGNTHNQFHLRIRRFHDRVSRKARRHEDHRSISPGLVHGLLDGIEDRPTLMRSSALSRSDPAHDGSAILGASSGVETPFPPGEPLNHKSRLLINQNCHDYSFPNSIDSSLRSANLTSSIQAFISPPRPPSPPHPSWSQPQ